VFEMPVRLGAPQGLGGLSANVADPRFSTGVGLVLHALRAESGEDGGRERRGVEPRRITLDPLGWFKRMIYS